MDPSLGQTGPFKLRSLFQISECEPVWSSTEDVSVQIEPEISSGNDRVHGVLDRYGPVMERIGQKNRTAWKSFRRSCHQYRPSVVKGLLLGRRIVGLSGGSLEVSMVGVDGAICDQQPVWLSWTLASDNSGQVAS